MIGRRKALILGAGVYLIGACLCTVANNIEMLLVGRILQGIGVCAAGVMSRAMAKDLCKKKDLPRVLSWISIGMATAPAAAPALGALLYFLCGWRSIFAVLSVVSLLILAHAYWRMRESLKIQNQQKSVHRHFVLFLSLMMHRNLMAFALVAAAIQSAWFCYVVIGPFIFFKTLGLGVNDLAYISLLTAAGVACGGWFSIRFTPKSTPLRLIALGMALCIISGLAMMTFQTQPLHLLSILGPMILFSFGLGVTIPNATSLALENQERQAGTASALIGFTMMGMSTAVTALINALGLQSTTELGAAIALLSAFAISAALLGMHGRAA